MGDRFVDIIKVARVDGAFSARLSSIARLAATPGECIRGNVPSELVQRPGSAPRVTAAASSRHPSALANKRTHTLTHTLSPTHHNSLHNDHNTLCKGLVCAQQ